MVERWCGIVSGTSRGGVVPVKRAVVKDEDGNTCTTAKPSTKDGGGTSQRSSTFKMILMLRS